jgi:hypothetical protein
MRNIDFIYRISRVKCSSKHLGSLKFGFLPLECVVIVCKVVVPCLRMVLVNCHQFAELSVCQIQSLIHDRVKKVFQQGITNRSICQVLQDLLYKILRCVPDVFDILACQIFPRLTIFVENFTD